MNLVESRTRIDNYIGSDKHSPIIVDVPNKMCLEELLDHYNTEINKIKNVEDFTQTESLPDMANMKDYLINTTDTVFLNGLTFYLLLHGRNCVNRELKSLLDIQSKGKVVIVTYLCRDILQKFDNRLIQSGRITLIEDENCDCLPTLHFYSPELTVSGKCLQGINQLQKIGEYNGDDNNIINIITNKSRKDFPDSEFSIREYRSSYDILSERFPEIENIGKEAGTELNWSELLNGIENFKSFSAYVEQIFGYTQNLSTLIRNFDSYTDYEKWIYFLALRTYGSRGNEYLVSVILNSLTFKDFIKNCFTQILSYSVSEKDYWERYKERKVVIRGMQNYTDIISSFCKEVYGKEKESLYYMTDLNKAEKEMTIELLSLYGSTYDKEELISILKNTYPDLALYLSPFDSGNKELDDYIEQYKYCKVLNKISDEFREKLDYQATEHHIYELQSRSSIVDKLIKDKNKTILYFMDAMGIEFLGFLQNKCFENKLLFHAEIGRCDLPSITSFNNGFVDDFKQLGCKFYDKKELDKLKHEGLGSYNYENTKIPIHVVEELNILNELIGDIKTMDIDKTAYIISDHGATRLAVINESEIKWEVSKKGLHSGRCCPIGDISEKLLIAVEDNGYWALANYDRFKGGRKASVEVHGGATIEEVAVPIITINKLDKTIECKLVNNEPIKVSYKQKAEILLYVEVDNENISISVNGKIYAAKKTDIRYQYDVQMPDIEKEGVYTFNVYMEGSLICKDLTFEVIKAVKEKKYFN